MFRFPSFSLPTMFHFSCFTLLWSVIFFVAWSFLTLLLCWSNVFRFFVAVCFFLFVWSSWVQHLVKEGNKKIKHFSALFDVPQKCRKRKYSRRIMKKFSRALFYTILWRKVSWKITNCMKVVTIVAFSWEFSQSRGKKVCWIKKINVKKSQTWMSERKKPLS